MWHNFQGELGPWDQAVFEDLVARWEVTANQPFDAIENPEFRAMLHYVHTHHGPDGIHFPSGDTMKRRVMSLADLKVEDLRKYLEVGLHLSSMFFLMLRLNTHIIIFIQALESKGTISLDAWSSQNGYAFLAIVFHYVSNDWKLGMARCPILILRHLNMTIYRGDSD